MTIVAAVILALGLAGAAAAYFLVLKEPGDISNPDVPFIDATPTPGPQAKKAKPARTKTKGAKSDTRGKAKTSAAPRKAGGA